MRALLLNPLALLIAAAIGWCVCAGVGWHLHPREMTIAAIMSLVAADVGVVPVVLTRGAGQAAMAQAALVGTAVHMLFLAALTTAIVFVVRPGAPFLYWVLIFYWATLVTLVIGFARSIRTAPVSAPPRTTTK